MNEKDFSKELASHIPAMKRQALYYTRDAEDADDIVSNVLLKAWRARENYQDQGKMKAWLLTGIRHEMINIARGKHGKRKKITASLDLGQELCGDSIEFQVDISESQASEELQWQAELARRAIEKFRRTSNIKKVEEVIETLEMYASGFDYDEISDILCIPVGTVKNRLHRIRLILREDLQDIYQRRLKTFKDLNLEDEEA